MKKRMWKTLESTQFKDCPIVAVAAKPGGPEVRLELYQLPCLLDRCSCQVVELGLPSESLRFNSWFRHDWLVRSRDFPISLINICAGQQVLEPSSCVKKPKRSRSYVEDLIFMSVFNVLHIT